MTMAVLPLHPDDPEWIRKARVAELHDLYLRAGLNARLFQLLLDHRHDRRLNQTEVAEDLEPTCVHCGVRGERTKELCLPCYEYRRLKGVLPSDALLEKRRSRTFR